MNARTQTRRSQKTARNALLAVAALLLIVVGWYLFRPELLFVDTAVNETLDVAATSGNPAAPPIWSGTFQSLAHETTGTAAVFAAGDGSHIVRLTDFRTSNGPDVRVYLVAGTDGTSDEAIERGEFVDLGALKGNVGDQNYAIPADIDLDRYRSISIWCRRFSVNFGGTTPTDAAAPDHRAQTGGGSS